MTPARQSALMNPSRLTEHVAAAGYAAKLGPADLALVLRQLPRHDHPDVIVGTETSDDAGVFRLWNRSSAGRAGAGGAIT
jgi:hypothetical protein